MRSLVVQFLKARCCSSVNNDIIIIILKKIHVLTS